VVLISLYPDREGNKLQRQKIFISFIKMTVQHNKLLNPIMGCLYVDFVGLPVSVVHMTIIKFVRAKDIAM